MTPAKTYDVALSKTDGTTRVELTLRHQADGSASYKSGLTSFLPPRAPSGDASYQQVDPTVGLIWPMSSWHGGCLQDTDREFGQGHRYGYTDGVLAIFKNELSLGYQQEDVDIIVKNGRFEGSVTTGWTGTNSTLSVSTSAQTGVGALRMTMTSAAGAVSQTHLGSAVPFQGRSITLTAGAKRVSGSGTLTLRLRDSVGQTDGTAVSSTSYTQAQVTRTMDATATAVYFEAIGSVSGDVWDIDDISVIPNGGVAFDSEPQEFGDALYVACGRTILKWSETNLIFEVVYFDATEAVTSLAIYSVTTTNYIIAGRGASANYKLSTNGTTYTDPTTPSGNASLAQFLVRARNASGDMALVKTRGTSVSVTTDPTNTANWGTEIAVGEGSRSITSAFSAADTLVIGKEDGLFTYDRTTNKFKDMSPELNMFPDSAMFKNALARSNSIYATGANRAFWRIPADPSSVTSPADWADLSHLFRSAEFAGFGGRVSAMCQDTNNIFVAIPDDRALTLASFPYTFPFAFATSGILQDINILALRVQGGEGQRVASTVVPHTISIVKLTAVTKAQRFKDDTNGRSSLFMFGSYTNNAITGLYQKEPRAIRLAMPVENEHPSLVATRRLRTSGKVYTSFMDWGFPDQAKAAVRLVANTRNTDADQTITVYYKTDGSTTDDSLGWTLFGTGVINDSGIITLAAPLSSPITFRRIRFRLDFSIPSSDTDSPRLTSLVFHAVFAPMNYLHWEIACALPDARMKRAGVSGAISTTPQTKIMSRVNTLRQQPFILFTDSDGVQYYVRIANRSLVPTSTRAKRPQGGSRETEWGLDLALTEVLTS